MTRTERAQMVREARSEIKAELNNAIKNRIERGTVVTSHGRWIAFELGFHNHSQRGEIAKITVKGVVSYGINNATNHILDEMDYTFVGR